MYLISGDAQILTLFFLPIHRKQLCTYSADRLGPLQLSTVKYNLVQRSDTNTLIQPLTNNVHNLYQETNYVTQYLYAGTNSDITQSTTTQRKVKLQDQMIYRFTSNDLSIATSFAVVCNRGLSSSPIL